MPLLGGLWYSLFRIDSPFPFWILEMFWYILITSLHLCFHCDFGVSNSVFFFLIIYLFIYLWLCWVFVSVRGLSPVAETGCHSSSRCAGLSPPRPLLLRSTGSGRAGSVIVARGPSCSAACGIFPDQGSNPCPPHWRADSQPLRHQGSPPILFWRGWVLYLSTCFSNPQVIIELWCIKKWASS